MAGWEGEVVIDDKTGACRRCRAACYEWQLFCGASCSAKYEAGDRQLSVESPVLDLIVENDPWCVQHAGGWCVSKKQPPAAGATSDATLCKHYITFRLGEERRRPTCADCLKVIGAQS